MRVAQLWRWIYHQGVNEFSAMRNIARPLLEKLAERHDLGRLETVVEQVSADGTRKWLMRLPPAHPGDKGAEIECVYIPESDRGTLCVSSQVGCTLNCTFCHTGTMPLVRNLTASEIVGQVMAARDRLGDFPGGVRPTDGLVPSGEGVRAVSNIVFMGMGEPLYNFPAVRDAVAILTDGDGCRSPGAASRCRRRAWSPRWSASASNAARCSPCRCTRRTTPCATSWCRSTASTRSKVCSRPAATIPAHRTRGGSPLNM
jgi:23S rRNA (adenine2503-C2)-methyltransferase